MAEVKIGDEGLLPSKRSLNLSTEDQPSVSKKQKFEDGNGKESTGLEEPYTKEEIIKNSKNEAKNAKKEKELKHENKKEEEEDGEEEGGGDHSNGETIIDRKGKAILIEEEEGDDDEDDDDDDSDLDSDSDSNIGDNLSEGSDFADDPITEVDLDNILPSRTRRKSIQPGAYIANDLPDNDSDESDDPDA